jgi:hypothetical protein
MNGVSIFLGLFLLFFARNFPPSNKPNVPSASFFPIIIAIVLIGLGIYNLIIYLRQKKHAKAEAEQQTHYSMGKVVQVGQVIALMLAYALLWHFHIGHFLLNSIIVFIPVTLLISDEVKWHKSVIFTISLVIFIYALFTYLLKVRLW